MRSRVKNFSDSPPFFRHCEERSDEAIQYRHIRPVDYFADPVIGRRFAPTRWLAMTVSNTHPTIALD
jgi:hypothetical protein